jgi:regulator of replication initiation timing
MKELSEKIARVKADIKELELELIRLREENEYMNRRLASKDIEFETYKKTMEENQ